MLTEMESVKKGGLATSLYNLDECLICDLSGEGKGYQVNFHFEYGKPTEENIKNFRKIIPLLFEESNKGLYTLVSLATNPKKKEYRGGILPDGELAGMVGNHQSSLFAENGTLYYEIEMAAVGCCGTATFNFGRATKGNFRRICRITEVYEQTYLSSFVYTVKHHYIDNMAWEELDEDDDEEDDEVFGVDFQTDFEEL